MADIDRLTKLINGVARGVNLSENSLLVSSLKVGAGQKELTESLVDKLISIQELGTFQKGFLAGDWSLNIDGDYELLVEQTEHGLSDEVTVRVEEFNGVEYEEVGTVVKNNAGDIRIIINNDLRFMGRVLIKE